MQKKRGIVSNFSNHLEDLDYADDICLISHKFVDMQSKVDELVELAKGVGLEINIEKIYAMRMNNAIDKYFVVQSQSIQFVKHFC